MVAPDKRNRRYDHEEHDRPVSYPHGLVRFAAAIAVALVLLVAGTASARSRIEPGGCRCHHRISVVYCKGYPHHRACHKLRHQHSRFTPDYGAAHYWTTRYFGHGWQRKLMLCFARRESTYTLAAVHVNTPVSVYGRDHGPWQVNDKAHTWVNFHKLVHSWRYAAAVAWHLTGQGKDDFSAWRGDWSYCGY